HSMLGALSADGALGLWEVATMQPLAMPAASPQRRHIADIFFVPHAPRLLFFETGSSALHVWDINEKTESVLTAHGIPQTGLCGFSPDGRYLVSFANREDLNLLDARTLQSLGTLRGHLGLTVGIGFSPDGKLLGSANVDQTARIWDLASQQEIGKLGGFGEKL